MLGDYVFPLGRKQGDIQIKISPEFKKLYVLSGKKIPMSSTKERNFAVTINHFFLDSENGPLR